MSEPLAQVDLSATRDMSAKDMAVRFAFGAGISVVAGLVGLAWGPGAGGLLLAFPAILPATLTLIEKKEDMKHARDDDSGATLGALALIGFAACGWQLISRHGTLIALISATSCWVVGAITMYLISRVLSR
jgi:uncharacterized membrane protein (GlpM family)